MRLIAASFVALALFGGSAGQTGGDRANTAKDDDAVRDVVRQYVDAREARDPKAVSCALHGGRRSARVVGRVAAREG